MGVKKKTRDGLSLIWTTDLEYAGSVWSPPGVQEVVFASADEPLATVGEFEGQDTALVEVELVLVRLAAVEHLHITALHSEKKSHNFLIAFLFKIIRIQTYITELKYGRRDFFCRVQNVCFRKLIYH